MLTDESAWSTTTLISVVAASVGGGLLIVIIVILLVCVCMSNSGGGGQTAATNISNTIMVPMPTQPTIGATQMRTQPPVFADVLHNNGYHPRSVYPPLT